MIIVLWGFWYWHWQNIAIFRAAKFSDWRSLRSQRGKLLFNLHQACSHFQSLVFMKHLRRLNFWSGIFCQFWQQVICSSNVHNIFDPLISLLLSPCQLNWYHGCWNQTFRNSRTFWCVFFREFGFSGKRLYGL